MSKPLSSPRPAVPPVVRRTLTAGLAFGLFACGGDDSPTPDSSADAGVDASAADADVIAPQAPPEDHNSEPPQAPPQPANNGEPPQCCPEEDVPPELGAEDAG